MKKLILLSFLWISTFSYSQNNYLENILIVKVKESYRDYFSNSETSNIKLEEVFNSCGLNSFVRKFPNTPKPRNERNPQGLKFVDISLIYELEYANNINPKKLIDNFMRTGAFQYVEPSYFFEPLYTPNDTEIDSLYYLELLNIYSAWDIEKGDTNVVIGISDTGFDIDHPDLINSVKYNYSDQIGNGIDDDGDLKIDNFRGWDFGDNDNDPSVGSNWHGVYVASFVGATADNNFQLAGTGFNCKIVPLKIESGGVLTKGYESIIYAAQHDFDIVNCSWGAPDSWSQYGQDVVGYATINKNCLVVASAGNDNSENLWYPASFDWVLSVGGTNQNSEKWVTSPDIGSTYNDYVDVMAPSLDLYRINNGGGPILGNGMGTSFSAPIVSGIAGLIKSKHPGFNAIQILEQLKATSTNIDTILFNEPYRNKVGRGVVNALKAVTDLSYPGLVFNDYIFTDNKDDKFNSGDTVLVHGKVLNFLQNSSAATLYRIETESPYIEMIDSIHNLGSIAFNNSINTIDVPFSFIVKDSMPANYTVSFKIIMEDGDYYSWRMLKETFNILDEGYISMEENNIKFSVGASGKLGFNGPSGDQSIGHGVKYKNGANLLYKMGVLATLNDTQASFVLDSDYKAVTAVDSAKEMEADMVVYSNYNDGPASSNKIGIEINQKSMAWSDINRMDFIILEMNIKNNSSSEINGLNFGLFTDWDIANHNQNYAIYDSTIKTGYTYATGGTYAGIHVISDGSVQNYAFDNNGSNGSINQVDGFPASEQHTSISNGILRDSAGLNDVSNMIGLGDLNIGINDSVKVAFALIVGDDYNTIKSASLESDTAYFQLNNLTSEILVNDSLSCYNSCDGKAKVVGNGGIGSKTYFWYDAPLSPYGDSISELCAGTYHVEIKDEQELKDTLTVLIEEPDNFFVNLGNDTAICQGDSIIFNAGFASSYEWHPGGQSSSEIIAVSSGFYSVTVTNEYDCSNIDTIHLGVLSLPNIQFTDTVMSNGLLCDGEINGIITSGSPVFTFLWSDNPARDSIHAIGLCPDLYTVKVTDQNSCFAIDTVEIKDYMLVNINNPISNYTFYPNPTNGFVFVSGISKNAKVFVTDIAGNIVFSEIYDTKINFNNISSGTYFINVVEDDVRSIKKISVQK